MKKRILAAVLAVGLLCSGIAVQAAGDAEPRTAHLREIREYTTKTKVGQHEYMSRVGIFKTCEIYDVYKVTEEYCHLCGEVLSTNVVKIQSGVHSVPDHY